MQLAADGLSYQAIAEELGYSNKGTVQRLVGSALAKTRTEAVETMQRLEGERLDALQSGLWDKAMAGDVAAGLTVLGIIAARAGSSGCTQSGPRRMGEDPPRSLCRLRRETDYRELPFLGLQLPFLGLPLCPCGPGVRQ